MKWIVFGATINTLAANTGQTLQQNLAEQQLMLLAADFSPMCSYLPWLCSLGRLTLNACLDYGTYCAKLAGLNNTFLFFKTH